LVLPRSRYTLCSRRTLFLRPVPHSPTVRHLAWPPHSPATDLDVSFDRSCYPRCAQRVGNALGKSNQHAGEQTVFTSEVSARSIEFQSRFTIHNCFTAGDSGEAAASGVTLGVELAVAVGVAVAVTVDVAVE